MKIEEIITARGFPLIKANHRTTLMITKEEKVGPRGDCIIAVKADKGIADLGEELKTAVRSGKTIKMKIEAGGFEEVIFGRGHPSLTLTHPNDIVVRKSSFTCERTLMIKSDKAAVNLSPQLVKCLRDPAQTVTIFIYI